MPRQIKLSAYRCNCEIKYSIKFSSSIKHLQQKLNSDVELGDGSASKPKIFMPNCKDGSCQGVKVKVLAPEDSIYMMYREYKVKDGAGYKKAPIIVSVYFYSED